MKVFLQSNVRKVIVAIKLLGLENWWKVCNHADTNEYNFDATEKLCFGFIQSPIVSLFESLIYTIADIKILISSLNLYWVFENICF